MATMRAVQVSEPGGAFELVEREVPGHEIAGRIAALGDGVEGWSSGQRVGVGWFGGNCGHCEPCRRGDFIRCQSMGVPGVTFDGGYADYVVVRANALARELGAHHYVDSTAEDPAQALQALGGARVVLATVTNAAAMTATIGGLGPRGKLVVVGASTEPIEVSPMLLIGGGRSVVGHASSTSQDSQDTLAFSALSGVRPRIETRPLEEASAAYDRMMAGDARFRMVLTTGA